MRAPNEDNDQALLLKIDELEANSRWTKQPINTNDKELNRLLHLCYGHVIEKLDAVIEENVVGLTKLYAATESDRRHYDDCAHVSAQLREQYEPLGQRLNDFKAQEKFLVTLVKSMRQELSEAEPGISAPMDQTRVRSRSNSTATIKRSDSSSTMNILKGLEGVPDSPTLRRASGAKLAAKVLNVQEETETLANRIANAEKKLDKVRRDMKAVVAEMETLDVKGGTNDSQLQMAEANIDVSRKQATVKGFGEVETEIKKHTDVRPLRDVEKTFLEVTIDNKTIAATKKLGRDDYGDNKLRSEVGKLTASLRETQAPAPNK